MTRRRKTIGALLCGLALVSAATFHPRVRAGQRQKGETEKPLEAYADRLDAAMERGLEYLAAQQTDEGWWPGRREARQANTAVASLCVMAFLARGHTPGLGPYGETINRGVDFVLDSQGPKGMLVGKTKMRGGMYSHGISTLMLSEVSGMLNRQRQERMREALPAALEVILKAQRVQKNKRFSGGWRYNRNSRDSDISCTGWPLMALRSARNNGAPVPAEAIEKGLEFILRCRHESGGFAYQPGKGPGVARTGVALLSLELGGRHAGEAARGAAEWIMEHRKGVGKGWFYYGLYYSAQGMYQIGEGYWEPYARWMYDMMLQAQREDGSWPPKGSDGNRAGPSYATAMALLALSVECNQLPIYQR